MQGMIKVMKDNSGGLLYRAVTKEEVDMYVRFF